jgi:hypothetical protein
MIHEGIYVTEKLLAPIIMQCINFQLTKLNTGPVPPPDRITLSLDHSGWLVFSWNEVVTTCEIVHYRIIASNCGRCPTTTIHLTAVCTNVPTNSNNMCTFAVQTLVCDGVAGNVSDPLLALLRGISIIHHDGCLDVCV